MPRHHNVLKRQRNLLLDFFNVTLVKLRYLLAIQGIIMRRRFLITVSAVCCWTTASLASSWDLFKKENYDAAFRSSYLAEKVENNATDLDFFILGRIYLEGLGASDKDESRALNYLNKAISSGSTQAALFLAKTYEQGQTVEKNIVNALKYYKIALQLGQPDLENKIAKLATEISGGDVSEASCPEILDAATKGNEDYFILAAKCYGLAGADASRFQPLLLSAFERFSYKDGSLVLDLLIDKKSQLYSPSFGLQIVADMSDEYRDLQDNFFSKVFNEIQKNITSNEFEASLKALHTGYKRDVRIQTQLTKLLSLGLESRSREIPKLVVNYLIEELGESFNDESRLQIIRKILLAEAVRAESKEQVIKIVTAGASNFIAQNSKSPEKISQYAKEMMDEGFCSPSKIIFDSANFGVAQKHAIYISKVKPGCLDGDFSEIVKGFTGYPTLTKNSALLALKDLCASGSKNGCHALGMVYSENATGLYGKDEAEQFSLAAFEKGVSAGGADSAFQLAMYYGKKGKKNKAIKLAKTAYDNGLVEGLYAESIVLLKGFFSASDARCKPLLRFLVEAKINNPYYEDARALRKSKKCK